MSASLPRPIRLLGATLPLVLAGCDGHGHLADPAAIAPNGRPLRLRPGDTLLDPTVLARAHLEVVAPTNLPPAVAAAVKGVVRFDTGVIGRDNWLGPEVIVERPYVGLPHDPQLRSWDLPLPLPPMRDQGVLRVHLGEREIVSPAATDLVAIPDPYFHLDASGSLLIAMSPTRPENVRIDYPVDPVLLLSHCERRYFAQLRAKPGEVVREPVAADLAQSTTIGALTADSLVLPAPGAISFPIDELDGDELALGYAIENSQFKTGDDGTIARAYGRSDGVTFSVEAEADGVREQLWSATLDAPAIGGSGRNASVSLAKYRGRRVTLTLRTDPGPNGDSTFDYSVFTGLRIYGPRRAAPKLPHVVFIDIDTLRADRLSCNGSKRPTTPQLDAWATREAVVYHDMLSTASWTLPATASMLTGMYVHQHGVDLFPKTLSAETPTLAQLLRDQGYETFAMSEGGYVLPTLGFAQGFDRFTLADHRKPDWNVAADWLRRRRSERPAFVFLHTYLVHAPYPTDERFADPAHPYTGALKDREVDYEHVIDPVNSGQLALAPDDLAYVERQYDALVRRMDDLVAGFLEQARTIFGEDDWMVVFTSDHGEEFQEHGKLGHGQSIYNELLRVPLVIRYPRRAKVAAGSSDEPASTVDIVPTVLAALGLDVPADLPGRSLTADLDEVPPRLHQFGPLAQGMTLGSRKLMRFLPSDDDPKSKPYYRLFDLAADPGETENLWPAQADEVSRLVRLLAHRVETYPLHQIVTTTGGVGSSALLDLHKLGYGIGGEEKAGAPPQDDPDPPDKK